MIRYALITLVLLSSCKMTEYKARRTVNELAEQFPTLVQVDTIAVHDTVIVPGDTVLRSVLIRGQDTVYVTNTRQQVRLVRVPTGSPCDTAQLRAEVLAEVRPDTLYRTVEVPVQTIVPGDVGVADWWRVLALCSLAFHALTLLSNHLSRR